MLNSDAFKQLAQLKEDIKASKDIAQGPVVGSNGRFGFVKLDDGRDAYVSPDNMQRLIPGDVVSINVLTVKEGKYEAELEKLITPALSRFVGQYRIKGKTHFIQPEGAQASRWIFVPPKSRIKAKEGEYVVGKLLTHPFKDGKSSAKVLDRIGLESDTKFQLKYVKAKYFLNRPDAKGTEEEVEALEKRFIHEQFGERPDVSNLSFVTIDSASTKDMDDALYYEAAETDGKKHHRLTVAIADPASFITQDSALAKNAIDRCQTTYLLGGAAPMLPAQLSHHTFSLEAEKKRPALLCKLDISDSGEITSSSFEHAVISSSHKLSYEDVAAYLSDEENTIPDDVKDMLKGLAECALARRAFREEHCLVSSDQEDFEYSYTDEGLIELIQPRPRTIAHQIVEEAMLATNMQAAELLAEHKLGLYSTHPGFREERMGEVKSLLKEESIAFENLADLNEFITLIQSLEKDEAGRKLIPGLRKMTASVELNNEAAPHFSMGVKAYTTITSPIRRFVDLYNHWCLNKILEGSELSSIKQRQLENLKETINNSRQADRELYQWLMSIFAESMLGKKASGKIRIVTQQGFGVKLTETGLEGFIAFSKQQEKTFDAKRLTLTMEDKKFEVGMELEVVVKSIDKDKRRIAFELA